MLSWLVGRTEPAIEFLTAEDVNGFRTPTQRRTLDLASMRTSEQVAQYVALKRIGYDVSIVPGDVLIEDMVCLAAVGGRQRRATRGARPTRCSTPAIASWPSTATPVGTVDDLSAILKDKKPGDVVSMQIKRPERGRPDRRRRADRVARRPGRGRSSASIRSTRRPSKLPFELSIDTQSIGGPSAGLAFTLTLIDELTPGELTPPGGVAVTGTMALDGTVGPIGGLRQKASAVAQTGVDTFIVPAAQGEDDIAAAKKAAGGDLNIIPVATLDEALAALEKLGGDPLPNDFMSRSVAVPATDAT